MFGDHGHSTQTGLRSANVDGNRKFAASIFDCAITVFRSFKVFRLRLWDVIAPKSFERPKPIRVIGFYAASYEKHFDDEREMEHNLERRSRVSKIR